MRMKTSSGNISFIIGGTAIFIGLLVIIGWNLDDPGLKGIFLKGVPMRPAAAIAIIFSGLAIFLLNNSRQTSKILVRIVGVVISLFGIISIGEHLSLWHFAVENFLIYTYDISSIDRSSVIIPANSALAFVALGISFVLLTYKWKSLHLLEFFLFSILSFTLTVFVGYIINYDILISFTPLEGEHMAYSLALMFILISSALIITAFKLQQRTIRFEEKLFPILTIIMVLSLLVSYISLSAFGTLSYSFNIVEHTNEVKAKVKNVYHHSLSIENSARGFIITGNESFVEPYHYSINLIHKELAELQSLTSDNPLQQAKITMLENLFGKRITLSSEYYNIRKQKGQDEAIKLLMKSNGQAISDNIATVVEEMLQEENRLLVQRKIDEGQRLNQTKTITSVSVILQLLLLASVFFYINNDITVRRRNEEQLVKHSEEITDLYNNSPAGYHSLDANGVFIKINNTELNWLGYAEEELIGQKRITDLITDESKKILDKSLPVFKEQGSIKNLEFDMIAKDGAIFPVLLNAIAIRDKDGNFISSRSTIYNITEKRKTEQELKKLNSELEIREKLLSNLNKKLEKRVEESTASLAQSEERLRTTLDNLIAGCQIIDFDYRYVYLNESVLEQAHKTRQELMGNKMADVYPGIDQTEMFSLLKKCMIDRIPQKMENEFRYEENSARWFRLSMEPIPEGVFILSSDITDKKIYENRLKQINEELEDKVVLRTKQLTAANNELEAFSYSVSHDLRAPLRHINGFIDLLKAKSTDKLDEKGLRYLNIIHDSATQMGQLIDDLLTFSRIGRSTVSKTELSFNDMIEEILEQHSNDREERSIKIDIEELPTVVADPNLIRQVWFNLISNAIKYTLKTEKSEIKIGYKKDDDNITFFVKDNGAGFDMRYYDKLFGVFQRLHSDEDFEGTGIGLANIKRVIDKHDGKVWAEGKENEGATFYFSLPHSST